MSCSSVGDLKPIPSNSGGTLVYQCNVCPSLSSQCSFKNIDTGSGKVCEYVYGTNNNASTSTQYNGRVPFPAGTNQWNGWKESVAKEIFPLNNMMDCCTGKYPDIVGTNPDISTYGKRTNNQCALCWTDGSDECNTAIANWCGQVYNNDIVMGFDPKCQLWANAHKTDGKYDQMMVNICQGTKLATPTCKAYSEIPNVNLDQNIRSYCDGLGDNAINDPICGCFLKESVYDNFFKDLSHDLQTAVPQYRTCYFPKCVQSDYKRYNDKQAGTKEICPSVNTCLIENKINNDGTINGTIIYDGTNNCTFVNPSPTPNPSPNPTPPSPTPPSPTPNPTPPTPTPPSPSSGGDDSNSWVNIIKRKWNGLSRNQSIAVICVIIVLVILVLILLYREFSSSTNPNVK